MLRRFWRAPSAGRCVRTSGPACVQRADCRLGTQPVRGHRGVIDGTGLRHCLVTLPAGGDGRRPGDLSRGLPFLVWCVALAPAGGLGAGGCGRGSRSCSSAGGSVAEALARWPVFYCPGRADEPDQEFVAAHQANCRPGRDHRPDGTVGPALGHVRRESRRDPQAEQPAGQAGYPDPVPCRVQHHHRTGVNETVDGGRLQPGGDPALSVCPDDRVRVPVGDICRDGRHGEHGRRRGQADGAVDAALGVRTVAAGGRCEYGHGLLLTSGWEEFGRPHPARTVPNLSQPS